ncbi:MAG: hypothetical protein CMN76_09200 [Spirochaetaceae bacterium]|nr:hypothetical protein [Spirochaetaceae bacterium]
MRSVAVGAIHLRNDRLSGIRAAVSAEQSQSRDEWCEEINRAIPFHGVSEPVVTYLHNLQAVYFLQ